MVREEVSVIIVNYNAGEMLTKCVANVLNSSVPVRVYISDNASSDNSLDLLLNNYPNDPRLIIHRNSKNLGFSAGNNCVFPMIKTPYILFLNPDCFIDPNTIEHLTANLDSIPEAAITGCLIKNIDGTEQAGCRGLTPTPLRIFSQLFKLNKVFPNKFSGYLLSSTALPKEPIFVELISGACMLIRKRAIDEVGLLDEGYFLYCEDYDWFYRFIEAKWKIIFTPLAEVIHIKAHSAKRTPFKVLIYKARGMWRYHDKFFKNKSPRIYTIIIRSGIIFRLLILGGFELARKLFTSIQSLCHRITNLLLITQR